jgi:hypothetical protein
MADDNFPTNIIRLIAAELHFQSVILAAREMFGRSYFSLGAGEKQAVDQAVIGLVGSNYRDITPEFLATPELRQPVGFGIPKEPASTNPSPGPQASS